MFRAAFLFYSCAKNRIFLAPKTRVMAEELHVTYLESPLGWLQLTGTRSGVSEVSFLTEKPTVLNPEIPECLQDCHQQLSEYFSGRRQNFHLKLDPDGTEFQQKVWQHLQQIPFGKTRSYLDIALQLGQPTYTRAVGSANGRNPLAIIVPCHRVIGSGGQLTGYAGGLWRKKWLLQLEGQPQQTALFN